MTNPRFKAAADTNLLAAFLKQIGVGDTATYEALSKIVGRDVRNGAYASLLSARSRLERQDHMLFECITNVGLKRLGDAEIVASGQQHVDRVRRASRRAYRKLSCVRDFDGLPKEQQVRHNTFQTIFSALEAMTKAPAVKRVESAVAQQAQQLPLAMTLKAFQE